MEDEQVASIISGIGWTIFGLGIILTLTTIDSLGGTGVGFTGYLAAATGGLVVSGIGAISAGIGRILRIVATGSVPRSSGPSDF